MGHWDQQPGELLENFNTNKTSTSRGRLKIFLSAFVGVGKTYTMLDAGQQQKANGVEVVIGIVDAHGRAETEALTKGLEALPLQQVDCCGAILHEFDLDAALVRHPALILIDDLPHTNAPGSRHEKRWQDVVEILAAGIDVYTALNVQHLESLNDVVAQITGIVVQETVPDSVLERADEIEFIDLSPDELLQRVREDKVCVPDQAAPAVGSQFSKGSLMALREMALRLAAQRVDDEMQRYKRNHAVEHMWPASERILVCIGPGPTGAHLVRAAGRMAAAMHAEWQAVHVETSGQAHLPDDEREQIESSLRLAEQLGGQTAVLHGLRVSDEILVYASEHNVTRIIVGKPLRPHWRERLFGSVVDDLLTHSNEIDVYVIVGDTGPTHTEFVHIERPVLDWKGVLAAALTIAVCTLLAGQVALRFTLANASIVMIYLLGVVVVAARYGRVPSILAVLGSLAAFDYFFAPPILNFAVADPQYFFIYAVMLVVGLTISTLTIRIQRQGEDARQRERRTAALNALSRELASTNNTEKLVQAAVRHISEVFGSRVVILLPDAAQNLAEPADNPQGFALTAKELGIAGWVYDQRQRAGLTTSTFPAASALYLPIIGTGEAIGVLGVQPVDRKRFLGTDQIHLLETFANQTALAVERHRLAEEAQKAQIQVETERLRNSLLSLISHDLRTPLTSIMGSASTLVASGWELNENVRHDLAEGIYAEAERLNRLVSNLLQMTRLESGQVKLHKELQSVEELVGSALSHLEKQLGNRSVITLVPEDLSVAMDEVLIEQVLLNLLENAVKYTPPSSPIQVSACKLDPRTETQPGSGLVSGSDIAGKVLFEVADGGPGLPVGEEEHVFEKFYRLQDARRTSGMGLGLAICRSIVDMHGGTIWAERRPGGGALFRFTLPLE